MFFPASKTKRASRRSGGRSAELLAGVFALAVIVAGVLPQPVIAAAQRALEMMGV